MNTPANDHLKTFLSQFDLESLGEGDLEAGINTLVSILCSAGNIAARDSGVVDSQHSVRDVSTNIVVSGSLSATLVEDQLLSPLSGLQENVNAHASSFEETRYQAITGQALFPDLVEEETEDNISQRNFTQLMRGNSTLSGFEQGMWSRVSKDAPPPSANSFLRNCFVFLRSSRTTQIRKLLPFSHLGQPFLGLTFHSSQQFTDWLPILKLVMEGEQLITPSPMLLKGQALITDPQTSFSQSLNKHRFYAAKYLWLLDGTQAMELPKAPSDAVVSSPPIKVNQLNALISEVFASRLCRIDDSTLRYPCDFTQAQHHWIRFLRSHEGQAPGVTSASKKLLGSLLFGIQALNAQRARSPLIKFDGVLELSKHLVRRAVSARLSAAASELSGKQQLLQARLVRQLNKGPSTERDLYRAAGIRSSICRELLDELQAKNLVEKSGSIWKLVSGQTAPSPQLEVVSPDHEDAAPAKSAI
ncbi:hypothetical protein AAFN60_13770 [Roseibacillus persicicus]|uniref:hypothetical protein n=1 Tax=Roseibacillus persicicus TaxID=454148 RepID=UPI00398B8CF1